MRDARIAIAALLLAILAGSPYGVEGADATAVLRRFVAAWVVGGSSLEDTITGSDSEQLVESVTGLATGGVISTTLERASDRGDGSDVLEGVVALRFADGGRIDVSIRATVPGDRVVAEPSTLSTHLTTWKPLIIEEIMQPTRGDILDRSGVLLASGPEGDRVLRREALASAIALIDAELDAQLGGQPSRRLVAGSPRQILAESPLNNGENVITSLDDTMQRAAEKALRRAPGALIVADPQTAGLRALVSNPEPEAPEASPATSAYSPGSAFKIVTAAAALDHDLLAIDDIVPCPPRISVGERDVSNFQGIGYGDITFEQAFAVSCNTAFSQIGIAVGVRRLLETAGALGFRVGELDEPGTIAFPRSRAELGVWSFGADGSVSSPMQMAEIASTIARGGMELPLAWTDRNAPGERVLRKSTAAALVTMMEEVVSSGTGGQAAISGETIAGKTGTTETRPDRHAPDAWFVALAPARETALVTVGFVADAGVGGAIAAPLIRKFLVATIDAW